MSKKAKHKSFKPGLNHFIRWIIFTLICLFFIQYFSQKPDIGHNLDPVLGESDSSSIFNLKTVTNNFSNNIPPDVKNEFNKQTQYINNIAKDVPTFIDTQIIKFKKDIVTQIYQDIIKNIENKNESN